MSATEVSVLDRLKALKSGAATPVQPPNSSQNSPVAANTPTSAPIDVASRLKALKMGVQTPSSPTATTNVDSTNSLSDFPSTATGTDIAKTQSRNVAIGALEPFSARDAQGNWKLPDVAKIVPQAFSAAKDVLTGKGTSKAQELVKGMVTGPIEPIKKLASGDWEQAAEGAGGFATTTIPAIEAVAKAANPIRGVDNLQQVRTRAIQSVLKPDKGAFDFGSDPVAEVANLPPTANIQGMQKAVVAAIKDHESQLQTAIKTPIAPGVSTLINVEQLIRSQATPIVKQAARWGRASTVKMVNKAIDAYLDDLRTRRGTTQLDASTILEEKRFLNKEIKFNPGDVEGQNLNALKMGVYRALDRGLDTLVPSAAEINKHYSGLIEAQHLLKRRALERGNADLTGETAFQTAAGVVPDIAIKTRIASALKPKPPVKALTAPVAPFTSSGAGVKQSIDSAEEYLRQKGLK